MMTNTTQVENRHGYRTYIKFAGVYLWVGQQDHIEAQLIRPCCDPVDPPASSIRLKCNLIYISHNIVHPWTRCFVIRQMAPPYLCIDLPCLRLVKTGLCLNPNKSEAILLGTPSATRHSDNPVSVNITGAIIPDSPTLKSLGVTLDS